MDSLSVLQAEMEKVKDQILSSDSEEQLAQTRLDILTQRLNYELYLDQVRCFTDMLLQTVLGLCISCSALCNENDVLHVMFLDISLIFTQFVTANMHAL